MNAYLATASLLLYPQTSAWLPADKHALLNQLQAIGLAGAAIDDQSYYAGEQFLEQIAFMGCAPHIRFSPEASNENFSHIRLHIYESVTALIGEHARAPNCPQCRQAFNYTQTQVEQLDHNSLWQCAHCQHTAAPWDYHWRKSAGFARVFIEITDIYPKEAVPQQELLDVLQCFSGVEWRYCYLF